MSKLTLVDGSGLLFRSYYGLPELSDDYGENSHMIYGMAKMTLRLLGQKPEYFAIARDVGGKTIRHDIDEDYKANRVKAPDDLIRQLKLSHEMIAEMRLPAFGFAGYEADDVIKTFALQASQIDGLYTTIISSDKDLKQLINTTTIIQDPMHNKRSDYLSFQKEHEFEPALLLDYLALTGDTADNIPGVVGIGPKTAKKLVCMYGTIENIYNNIDKITGSTKKKLIDGRDNALQSKELVKLVTVPDMSHLKLEQASELTLDFDVIRHVLLDQYQFHSLAQHIDKVEENHKKVSMQGLFG